MQKMKKPLSTQEIYQKLSCRCSVCEYAPIEIKRKAMLLGASADAADSITDRLVDENFINEQRYAQAFVHDKFSLNRWGKNKIAAALHQKHITPALVTQAIELIDPDEYQNTLKELLIAKSQGLQEPDRSKHTRKLLAFAVSRGFEPHLALRLIDDMPQP